MINVLSNISLYFFLALENKVCFFIIISAFSKIKGRFYRRFFAFIQKGVFCETDSPCLEGIVIHFRAW